MLRDVTSEDVAQREIRDRPMRLWCERRIVTDQVGGGCEMFPMCDQGALGMSGRS